MKDGYGSQGRHFENRAVLVFAMVALCLATLATNIAANVVSPANDFSHLSPRKISFRVGGFITGIVGIIMMQFGNVSLSGVELLFLLFLLLLVISGFRDGRNFKQRQ